MNHFLKEYINNKLFMYIPDLLLLHFSFISIILYLGNDPITSWFYISMFLTLFLFIFCCYKALYNYLNIPKSLSSFIAFFLNALTLISYIYGIYVLISKSFPRPIYVENLSLLSQYRYLFLSIFSILIFVCYLLTLLSTKIKTFIYSFDHSFLKSSIVPLIQESIYIGLFIDNFCVKLLNLVIKSFNYRLSFFFLQFFINYIYRLFCTCLFMNFCFFFGDLRYLLFCLPISFLFWVLSFFFYYFKWFLDDNMNYIKRRITVTLRTDAKVSNLGIVKVKEEDMIFEFIPYVPNENDFISNHRVLNFFKTSWLNLIAILVWYTRYYYYFNFINYIIIFLRSICWFYLCVTYFSTNEFVLVVNFFSLITKRGFHATAPLFAPRAGYWMRDEKAMSKLCKETNGNYSPGHPIWADDREVTNGILKAQGQFTTDKQNKTSATVINSKQNVTGNNDTQKGIGFKNEHDVLVGDCKEILDSKKYCEKNKNILDAISPKPKNDSDSPSGSNTGSN